MAVLDDRDSGTSHYLSRRTLLPGRGLLNLLNLKEDWAHAYGVRSLGSVRVLARAFRRVESYVKSLRCVRNKCMPLYLSVPFPVKDSVLKRKFV